MSSEKAWGIRRLACRNQDEAGHPNPTRNPNRWSGRRWQPPFRSRRSVRGASGGYVVALPGHARSAAAGDDAVGHAPHVVGQFLEAGPHDVHGRVILTMRYLRVLNYRF